MLPEHLSQIVRGFQASRILLTAIELNLFSATGKGGTAEEIAGRIGGDQRATRMLLDALVALDLLGKQDGVYRNTADSDRYFHDASPESERAATMHAVRMWDSWSKLTECVRTGSMERLSEAPPRDEEWVESFMAAMARNAAARAPRLVRAAGAEGVRRLLDIGGGPASYSIEFARANPRLEAVILDRPEVLPITRRHISQAGLDARISAREGDLREDELGQDFDMILLSNICHMLSPDENLDLLRRCAAALAPGGRVVIQDFMLNEDRTSPAPAALFAINMLVATPGGSSYTESEYGAWLREAGFAGVQRKELAGPSDLIIGTITEERG